MSARDLTPKQRGQLWRRLLFVSIILLPLIVGLALTSGATGDALLRGADEPFEELLVFPLTMIFGVMFAAIPGFAITSALMFYRKHKGPLNLLSLVLIVFPLVALLCVYPLSIMNGMNFGNPTGMTKEVWSGTLTSTLGLSAMITFVVVLFWLLRGVLGLRLLGEHPDAE